ncbi:MAG TPA: HAD hydrolase family protein [Nitrososphaeraceae archaeon]|nr:HAD hydrolase family protein [Nitrososphaeraceae archaeon]
MQISAILSDYDGTLCPTASIRDEDQNAIPVELENILWDISEKIPVCIVSSKDFNFLHKRTRFAVIASCILGIETLTLRPHNKTIGRTSRHAKMNIPQDENSECRDFKKCIEQSYLSVHYSLLQDNSEILSQLAEEVASEFKEVSPEKKFTVTPKKTLAGLTFDWRNTSDWGSLKVKIESKLQRAMNRKESQLQLQEKSSELHIQTYTTHPFIDIYAIRCNKGIAYAHVVSEIQQIDGIVPKIMYMGDSENDNPAFRKADVSIGVKSDKRLSPSLDCDYMIKFDKLANFLEKLHKESFVFSGL